MQNLGGEALLFSQQSKEQMLGADVAMGEALGFFCGIREHAFALIAQWEINRGRDLLADGRVSFDLLADRFDRGVRPQKSVGQSFIFAQESEKQVLSLYIRRPKLAGFVTGEE